MRGLTPIAILLVATVPLLATPILAQTAGPQSGTEGKGGSGTTSSSQEPGDNAPPGSNAKSMSPSSPHAKGRGSATGGDSGAGPN